MNDWLKAQALVSPDHLALLHGGQSWNYARLDGEVDTLCGRLAALGLPPGACVATLLPPSPEHICLVHALARLGLTLVPLNTRLTPAELQPQIERVRPPLLIGADPARLEHFKIDGLRLITLDGLPVASPLAVHQDLSLERLQSIVFTSGTTGAAKGVMLTYANHFWSAIGSAARLGMLPTDVWLSPLPLYHVGGMATIFRCALAGAALALCQPVPYDLRRALAGAPGHPPATMVSLVPTMLRRLLESGEWHAPALRLVLLGGAAADPALLLEAERRGIPVAITYGLTEAASQVATQTPEEMRANPRSVGRPLMNTQVRIVCECGTECPPETPGEILVNGPTVMSGYYNDLEASANALEDGWLHTGDIGSLDEDGALYVLQRRSDLIISGGENVYPAEVERALCNHPAVAEACVVGISDLEWGQQVAALVVLRRGQNVDSAELLATCREQLAGYKLPRYIAYTEALPLTGSGKVARQKASELLEKRRRG